MISANNFPRYRPFRKVYTGEELKDLIYTESDRIIVSLWYMQEPELGERNKRNLIVEGSLKRLISNCHNDVIYTEADLSAYNEDRNSFIEVAKQWHLDLKDLDQGPIVLVMYEEDGYMFWVLDNSYLDDLLQKVQDYIVSIKKNKIGVSSTLCPLELDYSELERYRKNSPWVGYDSYKLWDGSIERQKTPIIERRLKQTPTPVSTHKDISPPRVAYKTQEKEKFKLAEPNLAFAKPMR